MEVFAPTPAVAFTILDRGLGGGINFTASHNPPEYNGLKFSPAWGGPALPETTKDIEKRANAADADARLKRIPFDEANAAGKIVDVDGKGAYLERLENAASG